MPQAANDAGALTPEPSWVEAVDGYSLALVDRKILCKNARGKTLSSLPSKVRKTELISQLRDLRDWLVVHERECVEAVDTWMIRSLPVPRSVLLAVWPDPAWRNLLDNAVVWPLDSAGAPDPDRSGFFRGVDPRRGIGLVNLDGETIWIEADSVAFPHPVLLEELNDFRELSTDLQITQVLSQLFREIHSHPADLDEDQTTIRDYAGGEFEVLTHAMGRARRFNFRVSGGYAVCPIWEGGVRIEARFWIGADYPDMETTTDELIWVGENERPLPIRAVGPVAFSEGMRMASLIHAGRVIKDSEED